MLTDIFTVLGAYLWGAIPSAYLAGRYLEGVDIRRYGSGNVGASNLMKLSGRWKGFSLGVFDSIGKGTLPVFLVGVLNDSLLVQVSVGLAVIAAHNWSPYIGLTGGRGVATAIGVVLGFLMWKEFLILTVVMGLFGRLLFDELGFWTLVAMIALPILAFLFNQPTPVVYMSLAIAGLLMLKRLTANWERLAPDYPLGVVLACRIVWDRDVPKRVQWVGRRPSSMQGGSSTDVGDELLP